MESHTSTVPAVNRWRTAVLDTMGLFAIIWSIPLVIIVIGAPIALAVFVIRQIIGWAVAQ
jgi:hypothetical protein